MQRHANYADAAKIPFSDKLPSLPCAGAPGPLGVVFNTYYAPPDANHKKQYGVVGHSFVGVYEFGDKVQAATIAWGKDKALTWLKVLDESLIGPRNGYLCGDAITLADYLGSMMVFGGEAIRCRFEGYPNICRWLGNMKRLKSWDKVNEAFYKYVGEPNKDKEFLGV